MKRGMRLRHWFSEHLLAVAFTFAVGYQLVDLFLNYFVSGELQQGFGSYYQSAGGREDLFRFFIVISLFWCFARFSRNIILENRKSRDDLECHLHEVKNFAHSVMHDVKNPAIGIHTMAMLLKKKYAETIDDQGKHYFGLLEQTSKDIVALMEHVNIYIRSREYPLSFEVINVQDEINLIKESICPILQVRHITLLQQPELFPKMRGDRLSIHRIFRNLIDNAIKYGGDSLNRIILEYQETDQFHAFCVHDDGCGIDEPEQEGIFDVFRRAGTSGRIEGLGLGLAIVKELVEKHHGSIQINSVLKKGTTFMFTISKDL
ncbi:MAG: HAMP domain-containing sensor histidine kinase [Syntrophobacter sp.]